MTNIPAIRPNSDGRQTLFWFLASRLTTESVAAAAEGAASRSVDAGALRSVLLAPFHHHTEVPIAGLSVDMAGTLACLCHPAERARRQPPEVRLLAAAVLVDRLVGAAGSGFAEDAAVALAANSRGLPLEGKEAVLAFLRWADRAMDDGRAQLAVRCAATVVSLECCRMLAGRAASALDVERRRLGFDQPDSADPELVLAAPFRREFIDLLDGGLNGPEAAAESVMLLCSLLQTPDRPEGKDSPSNEHPSDVDRSPAAE